MGVLLYAVFFLFCFVFVFFSCLFLLFLFVEEKPYWVYVMLHVCSYSTKIKISVYVSSLREHLQFNLNSSVFIDHMVWYVPCMVRFVLNVVRFVLRWSVLSVVRFVHGPLCP